jgi:hypothetical protein
MRRCEVEAKTWALNTGCGGRQRDGVFWFLGEQTSDHDHVHVGRESNEEVVGGSGMYSMVG